jgi:4-aminobutyrate aminotransferase-like enzyme
MNPDTAALLARREALLGSAYRLFYRDPVHIVRGEGVLLYDSDGNQYLDLSSRR